MKKPVVMRDARAKQISRLRKQVAQLEERCYESEEALNAIRHGNVDALVVYTEAGEKIFTIHGAETTYRLMIEAINEGAATLIEDGTILYCNRRFAEMLSLPLESIISTSILQYIPPDEKLAFSDLLQRGLRENCREEATFIGKDGSYLPVMISFNNFSANSVPGACLVATDLTDIKKAENRIRRDALRAETMTEITRSLVGASLDEGAIMDIVAQAAVRLVGDVCIIRSLSEDRHSLVRRAHFHPDPDTNRTIADIVTDALLPIDEGLSGSVFQTGEIMLVPALNPYYTKKIIRAEFPGLTDQLSIFSLLVVPVGANDRILGTLELLRLTKDQPYTLDDQHFAQRLADHMALAITNAQLYSDLQELLLTEQAMRVQLIQAEKLSALNRMMATVVHEINNPVQTIKNCIYLAETEALPGSPQLDFLGMATSEIDRISKLVASLRDIYRQPKTVLMQTLDLSRLVKDVHLLLEPHLAHHKVTWVQEADGSHWVNAITDHLKQVFLNISLNAIDAMQPDGGTLTISIFPDNEKKEVAVAIKDTGCGIDSESLTRIFEPFYSTKEGGGGLGLSICYEIIRQHSGRISVDSLPGKGSTFTVWLPLVPAPA